jgi:soluble lytic murein transglycosylase-like protein
MKELIEAVAKKYDLHLELVDAIVWRESNYDLWAVRYEPGFFERYIKNAKVVPLVPCSEATERSLRAHSFGLMQIMGATARERGFAGTYLTELCDPVTNLDVGCRHLDFLVGKYFDKYGWPGVIAAYNAGSVRYRPGTKIFANQAYVDDVMQRWGGK